MGQVKTFQGLLAYVFGAVVAVTCSACVARKVVTVESTPAGAQVHLDGASVGSTPLTDLALEFNGRTNYELELSKSGYHNAKVAVKLEPKELTTYRATLDEIKVKTVTIVSEPAGATVQQGERIHGKTPLELTLNFEQQDTQSFTINADKYLPANLTITYEPRDTTRYQVKLDEIPIKDIALTEVDASPRPNIRLVPAARETIETQGPAPAKLTDFSDSRHEVGQPVISADGGKIFYRATTRFESGVMQHAIWSQSLGSGYRTQITSGAFDDVTPEVSNDGSFLWLSSNRFHASNHALCRVSVTELAPVELVTEGRDFDFQPSAGPEDDLVFCRRPNGTEELQVWLRDQAGFVHQLGVGEQPRLSPDGARILFAHVWGYRDGTDGTREERIIRQLWVMERDGSRKTQLTRNTDYDVKDGRWSPDGSRIVFASNQGYAETLGGQRIRNYDLWLMDADGRNVRALTTNASHDDGPCFTPKGESVIFRSNRGWTWNLWSLPLAPTTNK